MKASTVAASLGIFVLGFARPGQDDELLQVQGVWSKKDRTVQISGRARVPDGVILQVTLTKMTSGLYADPAEEYADSFKCKVEKGAFSMKIGVKPGSLLTDAWEVHAVFDPAQQTEPVRKSLPAALKSRRERVSEVRQLSIAEMCQEVEKQGERMKALPTALEDLWDEVGLAPKTLKDKKNELDKLLKETLAVQQETIFPFSVRHLADAVRYANTLRQAVEGERVRTADGRDLTLRTVGEYIWEVRQRYIHETLWYKLTLTREHWLALDALSLEEVRSYDEKRWEKKLAEWQAVQEEVKKAGAFLLVAKVHSEEWKKHLEDKIKIEHREAVVNYSKLVSQIERYRDLLTQCLKGKIRPADSPELKAQKEEIERHWSDYMHYTRDTKGKHF